jgi:microcystin-dependent protein
MELLEDLKSGKYNIVFIAILFVFVFHQYFIKLEPMANLDNDQIEQVKKLIYETYKIDVNSIKNLTEIANKLQAGGLTVPGNLTIKGELRVENSNFWLGNREKDQWIFHAPTDDRGGLWISRVQRDGNVNLENGLNLLTNPEGTQNIGGNFNLVPRGTVVAWTGNVAPVGWALCDGGSGTPDLRARFVLGWNPAGGKHGKVPGADFNKINGAGGEQIHQLSVGELASHSHPVNDWAAWDTRNQNHGRVYHRGQYYIREQDQSGGTENYNALYDSESTAIGGNEPHNNMPPYYVLAYIMKL